MSQTSPRLALPFIQSAQAQKHVAHNEAVELLDALVQLTSEDIDVTAPQTATAEGQAWGIGAGSGLWAGHAGQIATWRGGGWLYLTPQAGWRAWIAARGQLRVWDGGTWVLPQAATPDFNNLPGLGVNASSDATNRLAVSSDAVLFNHAGAGHQLKLNKASTGDTASLLFQSDWQGRAELGLAGSDNFSVKVSDGGGSFTESLVIDAGSGAVRFPAGLAGSGSVAGALGLQAMAFTCERNTGFTTGSYLAFGNGASDLAGAVMPFAGRVLAVTLSQRSPVAGTNTVRMTVNQTEAPLHEVTIHATGAAVETAIADFKTSSLPFAAGDALALKVMASSDRNAASVGTFFVVFD
jgi:hypothetical protein